MLVTRMAAAVAAGSILLLANAAVAAPKNPLIGTWIAEPGGMVARDGFEFCKVTPKMVFTPKTQTMFSATAQGTNTVIYLVSGSTIYVSSTPGFLNAPKYTILGPNEMRAENMGNCKYTRAH